MNNQFALVKIKSFKFWIFLLFILIAGAGSFIFNSFDPRKSPFGFIILFSAFCWLIRNTDTSKISKKAQGLFLFLFCWIICHFISDISFQYYQYFIFIFKISLGFFIARHYQHLIPAYYSKCMYILCLISLVCWLLVSLFGITPFESLAPFKGTHLSQGSFLLCVLPNSSAEGQIFALYRNSGYAWEPGLFASHIVIGIAFYMYLQKEKFSLFDPKFLVMFFALLTTMSTTGYISFMVLIGLRMLFVSKINILYKVVSSTVFVIISLYALSLPFMWDKISTKMDQSSFITSEDSRLRWFENRESYFTVDRFEGISLDILDIQYKPIIGCGLAAEDTFLYQNISPWLVTSNGITKPIANLGIVFFIIIVISLYWGIRKLYYLNNFEYCILFLVTLLLISISYNHLYNPIIWGIVFFSYFNKNKYSLK